MRSDLAALLTATRSEAKRWGARGPNRLLLAVVVAHRHEDAFRAVFGEAGRGRVEEVLAQGASAAEEDAVRSLLEDAASSGGVPALVATLHQELLASGVLAGSAPGEGEHEAPAAAAVREPEPAEGLLTAVAGSPDVLGREDVVDDLLTLVGGLHPGPAVVTGPPGSGRSAVARALAHRLEGANTSPLHGRRVLEPTPTGAVGGRAALLRRLAGSLGPDAGVLWLDDIDLLLALNAHTCDLEALAALRSLERSGTRHVLTTTAEAYRQLCVLDPEFGRRTTQVPLPVLSTALVTAAVSTGADEMLTRHGVGLDDGVLALASSPPRESETWAHPGLGVRRLDAACVRARVRGDSSVRREDLRVAGESALEPLAADHLVERLRRRVLGQDAAVELVARRLALTRAGLDLRPERPDGAFLLVGPTGVGKTELARALCAELFGDEQRLIRLDMSEYAHDWAVSRLVGPQPGYVGSTQPDSWLTTRVRQQPRTVVLLDEIEKAHPTVWNTFLQVLDAGRLSDSRGAVADFSETVVVMTSNLGASAFSKGSLGFSTPDGATAAAGDAVVAAVRAAMAPELVNRFDATVVFAPLGRDAIRDIADKEVASALDRLAGRGYRLVVDSDVVQHLADTGHDPAYGARHLQRNVERLLLEPLAGLPVGEAHAVLVDGAVRWRIPA